VFEGSATDPHCRHGVTGVDRAWTETAEDVEMLVKRLGEGGGATGTGETRRTGDDRMTRTVTPRER
jgi:hypothetical protein